MQSSGVVQFKWISKQLLCKKNYGLYFKAAKNVTAMGIAALKKL